MQVIQGIPISDGQASGRLFFLHRTPNLLSRAVPIDAEQETARFLKARCTAVGQLEDLYHRALNETGAEIAAIFQIHQALLMDPDFFACVAGHIKQGGCSAEYAVLQAKERFSGMLAGLNDRYIQGRAADVEDVAARLLCLLADGEALRVRPVEPVILAAPSLTPSDVLELDRAVVRGIVTMRGSTDSHFAILARRLSIPALLLPACSLTGSDAGKRAFLDADSGTLRLEETSAPADA